MKKMDEYQENRARWKTFLRSCSLHYRTINQIINKIPNNQAPLTLFWIKQTVDWLSDNRHRYLIKYGTNHRHCKKIFRSYDNNQFYKNWPKDIEINQIIQFMIQQNNNNKNYLKQCKNNTIKKRNKIKEKQNERKLNYQESLESAKFPSKNESLEFLINDNIDISRKDIA